MSSTPELRLIIAGGRDVPMIEGKELIALALSGYFLHPTVILQGGAGGIDAAAKKYAGEHFIPCEEFPAEWGKHGKAAGPIRNRKMAENAHALLAIWNGKSRGTQNMIKTATELGLKVYVYTYKEHWK